MAIKKTENGWVVDSQPGGRGGKRYRKSFRTQAEAKAWEAWLTTQVNQNAEWTPEKRDTRKLSELVALWFNTHGQSLRAGDDTRKRLLAAAIAMRDPVVDRFSAETFASYRAERISAGVSASNMNRELAYLRAMFNELSRLGAWVKPNPLAKLRQFKVQERELSYLTVEQIALLFAELDSARNKHVQLVTKLALSTGARWSEAEGLQITQIHDGFVQFAKTKSGKVRSVPIADSLVAELRTHHKKHGTLNRVFGTAWSAFREAIERAEIDLPDGQMTHSLRHTFASHFIMAGGNILTLQKILGHQSLTMTMRYAHLAPDHLQEAKALNPLALISRGHFRTRKFEAEGVDQLKHSETEAISQTTHRAL
ncbi:tyrosine-type recombinase/integrase [Burkholderia stagnalis]|uniref:phage integrase n=1 Tax=Burkholderia stagnalis TaxID=1503054 RepID=UPI00075ADFE5|nr:tyrosine-type recombinase/integrase [Burkholderia stagnalis]KWH40083.1 integrase [Burkholderia stagnalis]KWH58527.1 integrase [Burkholderia stagnalis]